MTGLLQEKINLDVGDGTTMDACVARPDDTKVHHGIIVLQEAFGVNSHIRNVVERLAREGYVAIAPELYHRTAPGFEGDYNNFNSVRPHTSAMTPAGVEADLKSSFRWLQSRQYVQ